MDQSIFTIGFDFKVSKISGVKNINTFPVSLPSIATQHWSLKSGFPSPGDFLEF